MTTEPKFREPLLDRLVVWTVRIGTTLLILLGLLALVLAFANHPGLLGQSRDLSLARTVTELKAMEFALEAYKADHGHWPSEPATDELAPNLSFDPAAYTEASACLYEALSGSTLAVSGRPSDAPAESRTYLSFQPSMLRKTSKGRTYIVDSWGNSFGYSTFQAKHPGRSGGYNPEFDLWSTANGRTKAAQPGWLMNH